MDLYRVARETLNQVVRCTNGIKILLMDDETTGIISMVFPRSEILEEEIYIFDKLDNPNRELMTDLEAICILRPTELNIKNLKKELKNPKYRSYYLFFTNTISQDMIEKVARADFLSIVKDIREIFIDYFVVNPDLFTLNIGGCINYESNESKYNISRIADNLFALLVSLGIKPSIRAQKSSILSVRLAELMNFKISSLYKMDISFNEHRSPLLLIMDRNEDPITPLLTPWTYQAMIHEYIGINKNVIDVSKKKPDFTKDQYVLSFKQDDFFEMNMYQEFADVGLSLREYALYHQSKEHKKLDTLEDIKKFVETYPQFRKETDNISKHLEIIGYIRKQIMDREIMIVSEIEQELACHQNHEESVRFIKDLLEGKLTTVDGKKIEKTSAEDALRIVLLYSLRYQNHPNCQMENFAKILMNDYNLPKERVRAIRLLREYSNEYKRTLSLDLFGNQNLISSLKTKFKKYITNISNIVTKHKPLLKRIIDMILENKLDERGYPYFHGHLQLPTDIIIFIVGGVTFSEELLIKQYNLKYENINFIIGGNTILNTTTFIDSILKNV